MFNLLAVHLALNVFVFWIAARLYLLPRLAQLDERSVLLPILLLHATRHLGLMFLAPGATYPGLPHAFAYPAAFGDLVAAALALAAIPAVATRSRVARPLVWIFNLVGSVDLIVAIALGTLTGAADQMGPTYWIPAFVVPLLLVTHYVVFVVLLRKRAGAASAAAAA
ncbi:MAG: hypothetical protein ACREVQ_10585 [Burkholderiales bacterium]